jgi:APA family basic amino acid/polyamine antiporter
MLVGLHPVQVGVGGPTVLVNLLVILAVVRRVALFRGWWNNITFTAGK